jgi:hypothetical protein
LHRIANEVQPGIKKERRPVTSVDEEQINKIFFLLI